MDTDTMVASPQQPPRGPRHSSSPRLIQLRLWALGAVAVLAAIVLVLCWSIGAAHSSDKEAAPLPQVTVSAPIERNLDTQLGALGQFSAVDQVELRAQVGGTLIGIHFKDGDTVRKGDLLFTIDPRPYEIKLAQAKAQLETANAKLELSERELQRAVDLKRFDAGTAENVEQRTSDRAEAKAAVDNAQAQIRDAQFDLEHCRITAPFSGRIGTHLVSVGNLIAGSRAATSPTTLLTTLVSLDPIYLNFDMSESDFQMYSKYRIKSKGDAASDVGFSIGNEDAFSRHGVLDFVDNALDRSSGTIRARATVRNPDLELTPGEFARISLAISAPQPTLLVPDASVLPDQSRHMVLTVDTNDTVVSKQVEIGEVRDGLRTVRAGLTATDRVIVNGLPYASPGSKVAVQTANAAPAGTQAKN